MAGIGFELEKSLKKESLLSYAKVYSYAAVLSSGAWIISIVSIILVGYISLSSFHNMQQTIQFQLIITYAFMFSSSFMLSGFLQLPLTRFIADRIYEKQYDEILPAYFATIFVVLVVGIFAIGPMTFYMLPDESLIFKFLTLLVFIIVSLVWIANVLASSLKRYKTVVFSYFITYLCIIVLTYFFGKDTTFLLGAFFIGNFILFVILTILIAKQYPSTRLISFRLFSIKTFYWRLAASGFFYNLGVWIDKIIFWYHPMTGYLVIGKFKASVVYDLPIFLAYLAIIPGMAILFYRLEVDFSKSFQGFYKAIGEAKPLSVIEYYKNAMNKNVRALIKEILVIQTIINIFLYNGAPYIFEKLSIPNLYLDLFYILLVGATLQLCFMTMLALLFYIDKRIQALYLSMLFFILNSLFSYISIDMGPEYFGYGYALSLLIVFVISVYVVREKFQKIDYETFMLQK